MLIIDQYGDMCDPVVCKDYLTDLFKCPGGIHSEDHFEAFTSRRRALTLYSSVYLSHTGYFEKEAPPMYINTIS